MNTTLDTDPQREEEDRAVKYGYACLYSERVLLNQDPAICSSPESAFFLNLEQVHLDIPDHLAFRNLHSDIGQEHQERIGKIWRQVTRHWKDLSIAIMVLEKKWENPPQDLNDPVAEKISEKSQFTPQERFENGIKAIASSPESLETHNPGSELLEWQTDEKNARRGLTQVFKKYIMAVRAYYEMLLEHDGDDHVFPKDHVKRDEIATRNRHLRVIDSFHHASSAAKAAHHDQPDKIRIRKAEGTPYVGHEIRTALAAILDILPYTIEDRRLADIGMVSLTILCAIHDVTEDSDINSEEIINGYVKRLLDHCDSSLIQVIKSGFPEKHLNKARSERRSRHKPDDEEAARSNVNNIFRKKILNLMNTKRSATLRQGLRILSNQTQLRGAETKKACKENIAGKHKTRKLLGLNLKDYKGLQIDHTQIDANPQSSTFKNFTKEYDGGKLARFLIRLTAITSPNAKRQTALLVKIEDRADNIASQKNMPLEYQLKNLRSTCSRLISWCMSDHNQKKFPLFNALPRLIDECINGYLHLTRNYKEKLEEIDAVMIGHLINWQTEVIKLEVPTKVEEVLNRYEKLTENQDPKGNNSEKEEGAA